MHLAEELGVSVVSLMQHTHMIGGKVGYSASFMLARINASKRFKGGVQFLTTGTPGRDLKTIAYGNHAETGEEVTTPAITWEMAVAEGWTQNSKYKSMPQVMFTYRAASLFARLYCSDLLFGAVTSAEELADATEVRPLALVEPVKTSPGVAALLGRKEPEPQTPNEADMRHDLEEHIRGEVTKGADEAFVRAACQESGICSDDFTTKLVAKLFPAQSSAGAAS